MSLNRIIGATLNKGQMGDLKGQSKGQKLASAIYLITGFFDEKEPLKWHLRTLAVDLVGERLKDKSSITKEIFSLFTISKNTGLISETNYSILAVELGKFEKELESPLSQVFFQKRALSEYSLEEPKRENIVKDKIVEKHIEEKPLKEFGAVSVKKNSRQSIIIGILKRKKEIMIKDASLLISGVSEKTIQRELLTMVQAGILRKMGEKRWSRYSLA